MDQRALFFIVAAGMAGLLIPVIDDELRYVPEIVAVVYVLLAIASYLDWRTNKR
jgi:hypothetical protein